MRLEHEGEVERVKLLYKSAACDSVKLLSCSRLTAGPAAEGPDKCRDALLQIENRTVCLHRSYL